MAPEDWTAYGQKDPKYQKAYDVLLQWPRPAGPAELRASYSGIKAANAAKNTVPDDMHEEDVNVPVRDGAEIAVRVYKTKHDHTNGNRPLAVIVHGGGYIAGDRFDEDWTCRILAREVGAVALSVEYRLTPEHKFPIPVLDCWDVVKWAAANAASRLAASPLTAGFLVGGNSAGGNMAAVIGRLAASSHLSPPVTGLLLQVPVISGPDGVPARLLPRGPPRSYEQGGGPGAPIMDADDVRMFLREYAPDLASPLFNPFVPTPSYPPTFLQLAGLDPLRDEALLFERELRTHGVPTRVCVYAGLPHAFWFVEDAAPDVLAEPAARARRDYAEGARWLVELGKEADEN